MLGTDVLIDAAIGDEQVGWGQPVAWFAPTYKDLADVWRDINHLLHGYIVRSNQTEHRIELVTGGTIDMWTLENRDAGRGRKYYRVVVDEAAKASNLWDIWTAAIRPTLTDLRGDAWFLSTPKGRNDFWRFFTYGLDPLMVDWRSWQLPTIDNPHIDEQEVEAARQELPEDVFRQEYLAEFLEDGAVFGGLDTTATWQAYKDHNLGHRYVMGLDLARLEDFTVAIVIDTNLGEACFMDRFNLIEWPEQVERIKGIVNRFGVESMIVDQTGVGDPIVEYLQRDLTNVGIQGVKFTNDSKYELVQDLKLAFQEKELSILNDPVLVAELQAYEADRLPSGRIRYQAPAGYHDDCVMSLALAWQAAKVYTLPVTVSYRRMA